jgi:dTDP-glucose 4,6-dehydratase
LITGGAGFVGTHLSEYCLKQGATVVCLDNLCTGRRKNIAQLEHDDHFSFVEADVCESLPESITQTHFTDIFNLASPASPPQYQRLAIETLKVGSIGTYNLLELARQKHARFIQASTSEVYGDPTSHPQKESYFGNVNSYGPRAMYDEAKRYAEALIYVYRHIYGVNTGIVRIFNTYGPHMDPKDGRVVSNFITQALRGNAITIYGEGAQTRSFCYVSDLVAGLMAMADSRESGPINLGNPEEYTVASLAEVITGKINSASRVSYHPLPGDDPVRRRPDITLAQELLQWRPLMPLDEGLNRTIGYFRQEVEYDERGAK